MNMEERKRKYAQSRVNYYTRAIKMLKRENNPKNLETIERFEIELARYQRGL